MRNDVDLKPASRPGTDAPHGKRLALNDGRRLGYAEFGVPSGRPVLYCHGFPASRLDGCLAHEAAVRENVRLIAPDRPGYGLSDFLAGRHISDWPRDLLELADALSLNQFAVLGISGGGPYAVACAGQIFERLTSVGIVCGLGQTHIREDVARMNSFARLSLAAARNAPALSQLFNRLLAPALRNSPGLILKLLASQLPPADREVLSNPDVFGMFADSYREAFRQGGRGVAHDLTLYAQPWETALESLRVPCYLWHGEQDATVPIAMAKRLASAIPDCRARFYADEGHFSLPVRRMDEILSALV
jgi:pimeloyl-ACP methyl ester carboxylesterase